MSDNIQNTPLSSEVTAHVEKSLDKLRGMFTLTAKIIEGIEPGKKIPATKISKMLEEYPEAMGRSATELYLIIKVMFPKYPGVKIYKGAHGGIYKMTKDELEAERKASEIVGDIE